MFSNRTTAQSKRQTPTSPAQRPARLRNVVAATLAGAMIAVVPTSASASSPSFACDPGFYQVIAGQLAELSPGDATYDTIGPDHSNYNAMGYRSADGYLYAVKSGNLIRISADGAIETVGSLGISGSYAGDFADDGLLHISRGGRDWHTVDVDTLTVTAVPELSSYTAVADVTNVHGKFYGVSTDGALYRYDLEALTITEVGEVSGLPVELHAYGAAWATAGGNLYVGRNTGEIYQITGYSTSSPQATQVGSAPATSSNDGASCALAPVMAGLNDVDGPEPETEPSTPESQEASDNYSENYDDISAGFVESEPEPEPEPVQEESSTNAYVQDAGIGQGAGCDPSPDEDRPQRDPLANLVSVDTPTVLFDSSFNGSSMSDFTLLSGNWNMESGAFRQLNTCGFDYTSLLNSHVVNNFRWEATFSAVSTVNHGGLVFNQSSTDTRSGAFLVDLAEDGTIVRWGHYDNAGYFQYAGSSAITAPAVGESVTLAVEVHGADIEIFYQGQKLADATTSSPGGMVGLVASGTEVAFEDATLTALPETREVAS